MASPHHVLSLVRHVWPTTWTLWLPSFGSLSKNTTHFLMPPCSQITRKMTLHSHPLPSHRGTIFPTRQHRRTRGCSEAEKARPLQRPWTSFVRMPVTSAKRRSLAHTIVTVTNALIPERHRTVVMDVTLDSNDPMLAKGIGNEIQLVRTRTGSESDTHQRGQSAGRERRPNHTRSSSNCLL